MLKSKTSRYAMFGSLYFSQGTVFSYFTSLNALYFLSKGLSMADVGVFGAIALIPFVIKVFLGMLSDRVNLLGLGTQVVGEVVRTFQSGYLRNYALFLALGATLVLVWAVL